MKPFKSPFPSALFIFLFLFLFLMLCVHGFTTQNLIQDACITCSKGDPNIDFDFCATSLQSAAPSSQSATLNGLGRISMMLIAKNVTSTKFFIKNLLKNKNLDPYIRECLGDCLELYSNAIYTMKKAIYYYNMSRFFDANIEISSIMDTAGTCEAGFSEKNGVVSPLTKRNNDRFELSAVSLALMLMLRA